MSVPFLLRLRRRLLAPAGGLLLLLLVTWVILAPAEARLGNLVKLVYVHGALVISGLLAFALAGLVGLAALVTRKGVLYRGADAAGRGALLVWVLYALSAMAVTKLTWGQMLAWSEPRVRVTALILGAALAIELAVRLVNQASFGAAVRVAMGLAPWLATRQAEAIRHPIDPIGSSGSTPIQVFFLLILLTVAGLMLDLLAWLWVSGELRLAQRSGGRQG